MCAASSVVSESHAGPLFRDRVALIVGAGGDYGAETARHLASQGAIVGLCDGNCDAVEALTGEIVAGGGQAIAFALAETAPEAIADAVERMRSKAGKIDILVNHSGEPSHSALVDLSVGAFERTISSTLVASFAALRAVVPIMSTCQYGRIINILSLAYLGLPVQSSLAASHAGLFGLTRSLALETAGDGITVNSLVRGDFADAVSATDAEKLARAIPVKRLGTAFDLAHAIDFLASPASKYVTGQTLFVCGGKSAYFSMSV